MEWVHVGDVLEMYKGSGDGFYANVIGCDVALTIAGVDPPPEIVHDVEVGDLLLRLFIKDGCMFFLLKVDRFDWIDAMYSSIIAPELLTEKLEVGAQLTFTVLVVDTRTGLVLTKVRGHLPEDVSIEIVKWILMEQAKEGLTLEAFEKKAALVMATNTIDAMVEGACCGCLLDDDIPAW